MTTDTKPSWCAPCVPEPSSIVSVASWPDDTAGVRALIEEYVEWLSGAAGAHPADAQEDFLEEIADLERWYSLPNGRMIVARMDGEIVGTSGVHLITPDDAELKRVYVRASARGQNLGRRLTDAAIREARQLGANRLLLETSPLLMPAAHRIYLERGFRPTAPYSSLRVEGVVAMERSLRLFPLVRSHGTPRYESTPDPDAQFHELGARRPRHSAYIRRSRTR